MYNSLQYAPAIHIGHMTEDDRVALTRKTLGTKMICELCGATLDTFSDVCLYENGDPRGRQCPGYLAIDRFMSG